MLTLAVRRITKTRFINKVPYGIINIRHISVQNNEKDKKNKILIKKTNVPAGALGVVNNFLINTTKSVGLWSLDLIKNPGQIPSKCSNLWTAIKKEAHHYWVREYIRL